jgi:UDP-N-acetylglucosamine acyltransferase
MSTSIHPTALVSEGASFGSGVVIAAYTIVEKDVELGDGCHVLPHAQILNGTRIGAKTTIGRGAVIGGDPQSLTFDPATETFVEIGCENVIREHVTVHRATNEGAATKIGDHNMLMVGSHVGHDTTIGDHNVIANATLIAGHVQLGSNTYVGGGAGIHQFLRIGDYCMVGGNGSFTKDIPHFTMTARRNLLTGLNAIGLRRAGFTPDERKAIKILYKMLFRDSDTLAQGIAIASESSLDYPAKKLLDFVQSPSAKGVCSHGHRSDRH